MQKEPVLQRLIALIYSAGIAIGDRIPTELELAEKLGVSRPVVRESLAALEAIGVVEARQGSGRVLVSLGVRDVAIRVVGYFPVSEKWIMDLLSVRQVMEVNMLQSAAAELTDDDILEMDGIVREMEEKAKEGIYFGSEDKRFHLTLYKNMKNEAIMMVLEMFWNLYDSMHTSSIEHSQRLDETVAYHRRILDAIKDKDIPRAQHLLNSHFYDTRYAIGSRLGIN